MRKLFLIVTLFLLLAGCGGGSGGGGNTSPIIGTWLSRGIQINNLAVQNCPANALFDGGALSCAANDTTVFRSDGTFADSTGVSGTYAINGNFITLSAARTRTGQISFIGSSMTILLTAANNIDTARLLFEKQ